MSNVKPLSVTSASVREHQKYHAEQIVREGLQPRAEEYPHSAAAQYFGALHDLNTMHADAMKDGGLDHRDRRSLAGMMDALDDAALDAKYEQGVDGAQDFVTNWLWGSEADRSIQRITPEVGGQYEPGDGFVDLD